jgi:hypothetical protein
MTGAEFRGRRTGAELALGQVAGIAGVPTSRVDAWEKGARLPYLKRRKLDQALWELERDLALAEPGAPACSLLSIRALATTDPTALEAVAKHVRRCKDCKARGRFVRERVRPEPVTGGLVLPLVGDVDRLLHRRSADDGDSRPEGFWPRVRADVAWGVTGGVAIALGFCAIAAIPAALGLLLVLLTLISQWSAIATSFFVAEVIPEALALLLVFPLYLAAGVVGGAIVGALRPLARWRLGSTVLGMIAGTIAYWSTGPVVAVFTEMDALSMEHFLLSLGIGSLGGGYAGFTGWEPPESGEGGE